jgi:hypothetical protein
MRTGITASPQVTREPDQSFVLEVASQLKSDSFPLDPLRKRMPEKAETTFYLNELDKIKDTCLVATSCQKFLTPF